VTPDRDSVFGRPPEPWREVMPTARPVPSAAANRDAAGRPLRHVDAIAGLIYLCGDGDAAAADESVVIDTDRLEPLRNVNTG
jgi:hypothetical protein